MKAERNDYADVAFWEAVKLAGGEKECGTSLLSALWTDCRADQHLQALAKNYLWGSSQKAPENLAKLREALQAKFGF